VSHGIGRRDLLRRGVYAAALAAMPRAVEAAGRRSLERRGPARTVIVIGAGLAGLAAAWELAQAGHHVIVLEARRRAGGRVHTLRAPFSDGLYAEAGGMHVYDTHDWTMACVEHFGLSLEPVMPSKLGSLLYVGGHRIETRPVLTVDWPLDLRADERSLSRGGMWAKYVAPVVADLGDPAAPGWPPEALLRKYDGMTFTEFLRARGASPGAVSLLRLGYPDLLGDGADRSSALDLLREIAHTRQAVKQIFTIRGGADHLPGAFASRLGDRIHYGAAAVRIEHGPHAARVVFVERGRPNALTADHVVCAVPFSVLRRIEVSPAFSPEKRRAVEELPYASVARVYLQTRTRFWLDAGLTGEAFTDLAMMSIYDRTPSYPGPRGILESSMGGAHARWAAALGEPERIGWVLRQMETIYPAIRAEFERGTSISWDTDEWARGAYAWFRPGQMGALLPHIARPEGRVHFAGEHTSAWPGWMQGALESGHRAAREANEAGADDGGAGRAPRQGHRPSPAL
jgi:monoamine oxidase